MSDGDLIRRGDARRVMLAYASSYSAEEAETAIAALPAVTTGVRVKPTDAQIASACMAYRHDFGLLDGLERTLVLHQARDWLHAWQKELDLTPQPATDVAGLVEAATSLLSAVDAYADTPPQSSAEALASCDVATAAEAVRAALAALEGKP